MSTSLLNARLRHLSKQCQATRLKLRLLVRLRHFSTHVYVTSRRTSTSLIKTVSGDKTETVAAVDVSTTGPPAAEAVDASISPSATDEDDGKVHVSEMDTRVVIRRGSKCVEEFLEYWTGNLPDLSERPDIAPESTRFWMMAVSNVCIYLFFLTLRV